MDWMSLDCKTAEVAKSSGRAEPDKLVPGPGDKGVQVCDGVTSLETILCVTPALSHQVCPSAQVKPTLVTFTLSHSCSRFHCLSCSRTGEVYSNKFRAGCWQNATYVPWYFERSTTHRANCEFHQHISPKQKTKLKKGDDGNDKWTYIKTYLNVI